MEKSFHDNSERQEDKQGSILENEELIALQPLKEENNNTALIINRQGSNVPSRAVTETHQQ